MTLSLLLPNPDNIDWEDLNHPSSIGDNFVVYVDDIEDASRIVGYRDGDDWYNEQGVQISDPTFLVQALLKEKYLHY